MSSEDIWFYERLKQLSPSQFEEALIYAEVDRTHLLPREVAHAKRAAQLAQYLRHDAAARLRTQTYFEQSKFFGHALPRGLVLVGNELRKREEEHYGHTTPDQFYTFKEEACWLGIFRDWDARRNFHAELISCVERLFAAGSTFRVAGIIGHGGAGKSVALRRLGIDLAATGLEVWWVEDHQIALDYGLPELVARGVSRRRLILFDEVQRLDAEDVRQLRELSVRAPSNVVVVAGRDVPSGLRSVLSADRRNLFESDEAIDQLAILAKIAQVLPTWAEACHALAAEPLRRARLVRLLVVLARGRARIPHDLEELESRFLEIIKDDIVRIKNACAGLAEALLFAATVRCSGYDLSRSSIVALADCYEPSINFRHLLNPIENNRRWLIAEPLISHEGIYDTILFHHDELADGVSRAAQQQFFEPWVVFDDNWIRHALHRLILHGSNHSSSFTLNGLHRSFPNLLSNDEALVAVTKLIDKKNGHHAYWNIVLRRATWLLFGATGTLLLKAAMFAPRNEWLWRMFRRWIDHLDVSEL